MSEPRVLTPDEVRDQLLDHIWTMISYWEHEERASSAREKLSGLAFTILAALDGDSPGLPAFIVSPNPHPNDREYHQSEGENWVPEDEPDLGVLHEFFHLRDPKRPL